MYRNIYFPYPERLCSIEYIHAPIFRDIRLEERCPPNIWQEKKFRVNRIPYIFYVSRSAVAGAYGRQKWALVPPYDQNITDT